MRVCLFITYAVYHVGVKRWLGSKYVNFLRYITIKKVLKIRIYAEKLEKNDVKR